MKWGKFLVFLCHMWMDTFTYYPLFTDVETETQRSSSKLPWAIRLCRAGGLLRARDGPDTCSGCTVLLWTEQ